MLILQFRSCVGVTDRVTDQLKEMHTHQFIHNSTERRTNLKLLYVPSAGTENDINYPYYHSAGAEVGTKMSTIKRASTELEKTGNCDVENI